MLKRLKKWWVELWCSHEFDLIAQDYRLHKEWNNGFNAFEHFQIEKCEYQCWKCGKEEIEEKWILE